MPLIIALGDVVDLDGALLWTLERGLGQDFTPEVRSAWAKVYHVLAATMQAGAAEVANVEAAE